MVDLEGDGKIPLYEKIYHHIRTEIVEGRIPRGEKLPSTRLLAGNLAVSRSTVEMAYDQLLAEGYIRAEPCRGFFVCDISGLYQTGGQMQRSPEEPERIFLPMRWTRSIFRLQSGERLQQTFWRMRGKSFLTRATGRGNTVCATRSPDICIRQEGSSAVRPRLFWEQEMNIWRCLWFSFWAVDGQS